MKKLTSLVLLLALALCLTGCSNEASDIAFIGGADGPTAVFVSSNLTWPVICGLIGVIIVAVIVALIIYRNKKKK
ncbi:MAG: sodium ion-translocating decarboxylase subunit beta [Clostridia bacterium]|nr:sodium ion-translocating decarboxylase subunit beta [Clostridia bacterium]